MATQGRPRKDGSRTWRAHWRDDAGRQHNKTFSTEKAARAWEAKMRQERDDRLLRRNTLARETRLRDWIGEWWDRHVVGHMTLATQEGYAHHINKRIDPVIGGILMIDLTGPRVAEFRDQLLDDGVTPGDVAYAMTVLSSCLGKAVERGLLTSNPCRGIGKPTAGGTVHQRWPVAPEEVETLRREFLTYRAPNSGAWTALRSATLTAVMAYAGLRPEEAIALKVGAYHEKGRVLIVEDVFAADHRRRDTKTHMERVVQLPDALVEDLTLWIDVLGTDDPDAWMFPSEPGQEVSRYTHRNWRARPWARARDAAVRARPEFERTLGRATPRDLRAAHVSLLARAGWSDADIAEETGHSVEVLRKHYLGPIKTLRRMPTLPEQEQIRLAREKVGTPSLAQALRRELLGTAARPEEALVQPRGVAGSKK